MPVGRPAPTCGRREPAALKTAAALAEPSGSRRWPLLRQPAGRAIDRRRETAPAAAEQEWIGTVEWNKSDYDALVHQFEWPETPSTLAIILAQEDLWVYEALARVIQRTNEGATGYANAAVKQINALEIGQNAAKAWRAAEGNILSTAGAPGPAAPPPGGGAHPRRQVQRPMPPTKNGTASN